MKKLVLFIFSMAALQVAKAQDTCNDALSITIGTYTVTTVDGSEFPTNICTDNTALGSHGEWYTYTPATDHFLTVTTDLPQNAGKDTRFHVYTGSCGNLSCYASGDDEGSGYLSVANFSVSTGVTYTIAFDDRWSATGFDFELLESSTPPISFSQSPLTTTGSYDGVIDMNGDFLDDVVSVTSTNINVQYQTSMGTFASIDTPTTTANFMPTWSMAGADYNGDGFIDLLYGSGAGVTFMRSNGDGTFTEVSGSEYVFSQRSNFVDINNDGHLDAFVCHDVDPNVYYLNDGAGNLVFHQGADATGIPSGLGLHIDGGNYGTIWIDYDNDHDMDLFIAKCRGGASTAKINELWRNNGDNTFTNVAGDPGVNMADPVQTWSSAWGDFNNDGYMDAYVGANSFADGGHKLMMNNGDGTFTDSTAGTGLDTYTTGGRENSAHDFNNDGFIDLAANGDILINNGDMTFTIYNDLLPNNNGHFGDLNNDGFMDSFQSNTIYYNEANDNNWLKVITIGNQSNKNGIGARVEITSALGTQIRDVRSGEGFANMGTINTHFGIGEDDTIDSVVIYWPSGTIDTFINPIPNETLVAVEGATLSVEDVELADLTISPNPAQDFIYLNSSKNIDGKTLSVFDINGKRLLNFNINGSNRVNVSTLSEGLYILRIEEQGKAITRKFIKK